MKKLSQLFCSALLTLGIIIFSNYIIFAQQQDMTIDSSMKDQVISNLVKNLNTSYVFPKIAKQIQTSLQSKKKQSEYTKITSGLKFAEKLTKDLYEISKDKHLRIRFSYSKLPVRKAVSRPTKEEVENRLRQMSDRNYGFEKVERLDGNIGYIELRGFMSRRQGKETVAAAMNFVANTDALIFDLRRNGGGSPNMVALICSYLFGDEKVHLNDLYFRPADQTQEFWTTPKVQGKKYLGKDVYILTSKRTFSAAEEFSYNLRNLKRATIVGETTGGGAHPGGTFRLSGHFGAFISTGRAISPITKTNWEGVGVKPHIAVSKEKALKTAYLSALEKSIGKETNDRRKASMGRLITNLKNELRKMKTKKAK